MRIDLRRLGFSGCLVAVLGCGGPSPPPPPAVAPVAPKADDAAYLVGTWTTSLDGYEAAGRSDVATRIETDGTLVNGRWSGDRLVDPTVGESPGFVAHIELDPAAHTIRFFLDGAEESATYTFEPPDRWKTLATDEPPPVTVYHVRRAVGGP